MPPAHRGTTVIPIQWKLIKEVNGNRVFEGIAYTAGIKGHRKRVTCSDQVWNSPDDNGKTSLAFPFGFLSFFLSERLVKVFYHDESVRFTVDELSRMNLMGKPIRIQHNTTLPQVGQIVHNWTDKQTGYLHILGEIPATSKYGQAAISLVDNGTCSELSISYPLERNPATKEVSHLEVDEVSIVTKGHFDNCRINIRASKSQNHKTQEPRTEFRTVKANMSTPATPAAAPAAAAETKEKDPTTNLSPEEIIKNSVAIKKRIAELENAAKDAENARLEAEERAKKADAVAKKYQDAEDKARKEYAEKHAADAEEVTAHMLEILAEQGMDPSEITDEWKAANKAMLTSDDTIGRQAQAVQVSCSRGYRAMKQRLAELEARNGDLEKAVQLGQAVLDVEEDDLERHERRDLKAAARNTAAAAPAGMMEADTAAVVEPPKWLLAMTGGDRSLNAPYRTPSFAGAGQPPQQRQLTAASAASVQQPAQRQAAAPAPRQKKSVAAAAAAAQPQQQQQQQGPRPLRSGYPVNEHSMRNSEWNRALWDFTKQLVPTTSTNNALAPIAGADFERREGM